ncbi:MAG: hypothetical protein KC609_14740 [Myxococcales bacterium]|nr:hypothetical protein [Myxococcales bacterium]
MNRSFHRWLVLTACFGLAPSALWAFPGMKGPSPGPVMPSKMPKKNGPTSQPVFRSGSIYCRVVHFERDDMTSKTSCERVELQIHDGRGKRLVTTLKNPTFVAGFCRFTLKGAADRSYTCAQTYQGVEYISKRVKKLSSVPILLVVADSTTSTKTLKYGRVDVFYQLGEGSRSIMGQVQGFLTLTNAGNRTVDCRTKGWRLPLLVPTHADVYGLAAGWSPHTAKKGKGNGKVEAMQEKESVQRGPNGWEFRGVLRPGKSIRILQTLPQLKQTRSTIELQLEAGAQVSEMHLGMPYTRLYTPELTIDGTSSTQIDDHRGMKLFSVSTYKLDGERRPIAIVFGRLPVPSNRGAHVAFYLIVALALAAVVYLFSRPTSHSRAAR